MRERRGLLVDIRSDDVRSALGAGRRHQMVSLQSNLVSNESNLVSTSQTPADTPS